VGFLEDHLELVGVLLFFAIAFFAILRRKRQHSKATKVLNEVIRAQQNEPLSLHPQIDLTKCTGCAACVAVCPEGDILKLINHQAVLIKPTKCVGHGECERSCPRDAITLVFGTKTRGMEIPRITSNYETNVPGLYIAGELGGMGLIRNAVKQGNLAALHALSHLAAKAADVDLLVVGAGPAGISASLTAIEKKASYLCIEQNTFGGTISNFPRQKIVMTAPAILPVYGEMKFNRNKISKEEMEPAINIFKEWGSVLASMWLGRKHIAQRAT
jgi:heterodisulfide reductase subunit A-like polyferredoxin